MGGKDMGCLQVLTRRDRGVWIGGWCWELQGTEVRINGGEAVPLGYSCQ